jgi:hypothetical protein
MTSIRHSYSSMNGMAYFAPKRMERRGMAIRADPKPVRVLISIAKKMIRKAKVNGSIMVSPE